MYKEVFIDYFERLLNLPLDDATFIAKLRTNKLLPGDTGSQIEAKLTPNAKASYFLNHIIKCSIDVGDTDCFKRLLTVMEQCGYDHIKVLALKMKAAIEGGEDADEEPNLHASTSNAVSSRSSRIPRNAVKCAECGIKGIYGEVTNRRKATYGHPYYYCASHGFIEWKNTAGVKCACQQKAKKNIVKRGPNRDKWFYNCKNNQCKYFVWSSDVESTYGRKITRMKGYKYPYAKRSHRRNYK